MLVWRDREDGNWGAPITYFCLYSDLSLSFAHSSVKIQLLNFYVDLIGALLCWRHPNLQFCFEFLTLSLLIRQPKLKDTSTLHPHPHLLLIGVIPGHEWRCQFSSFTKWEEILTLLLSISSYSNHMTSH